MKSHIKSKRLTLFGLALLIAGCSQLPVMPTSNNIVWLDQGWTTQERQKFHHASQGTMTLPIPYEWFAALEQPGFKLFGTKGLIIENGYLSRLGFITGEVTPYNQASLPVGFSVDYNVTNPAISKTKFNAIGLTCAACHTGQMRVNNTSIRYDGGPAMTNLTELTTVLGLALIETYLDPGKFDRFAQNILGVTNTETNKKQLKSDLEHTLLNLVKSIAKPKEIELAKLKQEIHDKSQGESFKNKIETMKEAIHDREKSTVEGFTRLDALNRIGNAVFGTDTGNLNNVAVTDAPVNYPHIWDTSWFLWVQYDASIMGPMIRNAGEAMGVSAYVKLDKNASDNFDSSVKLDNLHWMETLLAGDTPPQQNKRFSGLQHPKWREDLMGKIDTEKHKKGAKLYTELCQGCHLPPIDSHDFWASSLWTKPDANNRSYLDLPIVDINYLGTDPQEALVLINRTVDTTGVGLNTKLYVEDKAWFTKDEPVYYGGYSSDCKATTVTDGPAKPFSVSLGAAVQNVNDYWYKSHNTSAAKQAEMNGYRENCLRAPYAYKARPLNGIWATAPYLHNGSVPNIYALLSPMSENQRPDKFYLGSLDYDTEKLGYKMIKAKGFFELNTSIKGNSNQGHEFSDTPGKGVIGRGLSVEERYQLIEYLKDVRELDASKIVSMEN